MDALTRPITDDRQRASIFGRAIGRTHVLVIALCASCIALFAAPVIAAEDAALERTVKAAFVYKFLSYVEWPAGSFARPDSPIVIGVYGADDIAAELAQVVPG